MRRAPSHARAGGFDAAAARDRPGADRTSDRGGAPEHPGPPGRARAGTRAPPRPTPIPRSGAGPPPHGDPRPGALAHGRGAVGAASGAGRGAQCDLLPRTHLLRGDARPDGRVRGSARPAIPIGYPSGAATGPARVMGGQRPGWESACGCGHVEPNLAASAPHSADPLPRSGARAGSRPEPVRAHDPSER